VKEHANRLAMQHLVNAYSQETYEGRLLEKYQQYSTQLIFSLGLTLRIINSIAPLKYAVYCTTFLL